MIRLMTILEVSVLGWSTAAIAQVAKLGNAHCVIETITDLMPCIDDIEMRLRRGQQPGLQLGPRPADGIV